MNQDIQKAYASTLRAPIAGAGLVSRPEVVREKAAIDSDLSALAFALENLHNSISNLGDRINPVSSQLTTDSDGSEASEPPQGSSETYNRIHESVRNAWLAKSRIDGFIRTLEI